MASDWNEYKIDDLKAPVKGSIAMGPFGSRIKAENFVTEGIPVIKGGQLHGAYVLDSGFDFLTPEKAEELKSSQAYRGDLVITHRGTIGQVSIIPHDSLYEKYIVSQSQLKVSFDTDKVNPYFVNYFFRSHLGQHRLLENASQVGVPAIAKASTSVKVIMVPCPSLEDQTRVVEHLKSLDDKIKLNLQMNETLDAMAQEFFKSWFVDFDPVIDNALAAGNAIPDEFAERAAQRKSIERKDNLDIHSLFPDEFELTEEIGWIPKGWIISTLDDLTTELRRGISPKYTEVDGVRVVNQRCIRNHSIDYSVCRLNDATIRKVDGRYLEVGDVLVNSTGVGTLGRMAQVFYLDEPAVVDSHVTVVRPNTELVKPYTFGRLMLSIEPLVESMGLGSTGQTELSRVHLGELVVCIPPIELQEFVEKSFLSYSDKSAFNIQQNITLAKLRDTLLPKLMSGELRIPDAAALVDEAL